MQYKIHRQFKGVIYVVANDAILKKVQYQVTGRKERPDLPQRPTGQFFFGFAKELIDRPIGGALTNGERNFRPLDFGAEIDPKACFGGSVPGAKPTSTPTS